MSFLADFSKFSYILVMGCFEIYFKSVDVAKITHYTGSPKVSGLLGLKISLQVITVTRFSVSLRLMILCVQPGII